ncbi:PD-(D/E)XK motif protein [Chitinophaga sp. 22321]|uniref:PD-(D/E)XK motif protein n=1 Tax=Chitinophaga hostae TaxID=2831022 RepID=A0ABS5ISX2_9BACT|nr:PD-(D/E)XK motif protein [Chitinophaga hostae]MBS0026060.1 PD-(D/E)XK motif protein [Chitinophaga hostae]
MNIQTLETKWLHLTELKTQYPSLRIDGECLPDLFVGLQENRARSLILKLPSHHLIDFQPIEKINLSIQLYPDPGWIILKLLDNRFSDLFNNLILSLYNKIHYKSDVKEYGNEFVQTFYKWSEFFEERSAAHLSEEAVKGIFGELVVLNEFIEGTAAAEINDLLTSWNGPYNNRHDFEMQQKSIEVKTKEAASIYVKISSEYQLEELTGKSLELAVVSISRDSQGLSLQDLIIITRNLVTSKLGDFTIILKALNRMGLNALNAGDYNQFMYKAESIHYYNCCADGFPRIIYSGISRLLNHVQYHLVLTGLEDFIIGSKIFTINGD